MKNKLSLLAVVALFLLFSCDQPEKKKSIKHNFPSYNNNFPPPVGTKDIFELSQDYPDTFKVDEKYPWVAIDFKTDYEKYMKSVLDYCLEGNIDVDFKVQNNKIRKWYHAPWLHSGTNGREYHHGLTRERRVPKWEISPTTQDTALENWAIGFYNPPGGFTIGRVWNSDSIPSVSLADFPEGTVSFKLLFTHSPVEKLPFLAGTKTWLANIYKCDPRDTTCAKRRDDDTVRLLQIDIAVKDKRAGPTGWVFGTFIFDASKNGSTVWDKIVPVGLMWGDDSVVDTLMNKERAFINPSLKETVLNSYLMPGTPIPLNRAFMNHHGLGGRLNGPVDNPISSCISCHSKALVTDNGSPAPLAEFALNRKNFNCMSFYKYFSTIRGGNGQFDFVDTTLKTFNKLDYSLQLAVGIRNFYQAKLDSIKKLRANIRNFKVENFKAEEESIQDLPEVSRGGN